MRLSLFLLLALLALGLATAGTTLPPARPAPLGPPQLLFDGSHHRDCLYPCYADFDGDGTIDQLVGVGDRLLVFRNHGTTARPAYAPPTFFDAVIPAG